MIKRLFISLALSSLVALPVSGQAMRELQPDELRANVESGATKSLAAILKIVADRVDGEVVDVRAFDSNGIYYQVLLMLPGGKLASVVLDAVTGNFLPNDSQVAALVRSSAKAPKSNNGKSATAGSNGNGNGQGNGNSNGGGSGNGNSGGNGNGNSGGNGKK